MPLSAAEEIELLELLEAEAHYESGRKLYQYFPDTGALRRELYTRHMEFFAAGATHSMRLMLAANRVGKTEGFGCELTYHLTGEYPEWWQGRRFNVPITAWAAGDTNPKTKEIIQAKLFGTDDYRQTDKLGTGIIPRERLGGITPRPGVPGAIESARIKSRHGGESNLTLKSFEQGIAAFQGNEVHVIWADELMPAPILDECVIRTASTPWFEGGLLAWTVTPVEGLTDGIMEFLPTGEIPTEEQEPPKYVVNATWDDVPHLSEETKAVLKAGIRDYQLDARSRGIPMLGAGAIYPLPEEAYLCEPFEIPPYWRRCYALDVGWERTAALWGAYNPDNGTWYAYNEHYRGHAEPSIHAAAIRGRGEWIPGVFDPAARGRAQADGRQLANDYRDLGLDLYDADHSVEAGLYHTFELLSTGRLKIFNTMQHLRGEIRLYRRDQKGRVVKVNDHLCDCLRYLAMSGVDIAKQVPVKRELDPIERLVARDRVGGGNWMR